MRIVSQEQFLAVIGWPFVGIGDGDSIIRWVKPTGYCAGMTIDTGDGRHIYIVEDVPMSTRPLSEEERQKILNEWSKAPSPVMNAKDIIEEPE